MLASAQRKIAAGRYQEAHQELVHLLSDSDPRQLSARDRRAAWDGLCLSEYHVGAPVYTLERQRRDCMIAAAQHGNNAALVLARINTELARRERERIEHALRRDNLSEAVTALLHYQEVDGSNRRDILRWRAAIWTMVERDDRWLIPRHERRRQRIVRLISAETAKFRSMNRRVFIRWVQNHGGEKATADRFREVMIIGHTLDLTVGAGELREARFGPATFGRINDAFSAWCGCYGDTHAISAETGMPVYLSRINGLTMRSEVLALPWR